MQVAGIGVLAVMLALVGHEYHLYSVVIGPVPDQRPTLAVIVRPAITEVGLKLGAVVLVGATRIGPKEAEKVTALSVPTLFVAVLAVTLETKCLPTMALVRSRDALVAPEIKVQLAPRLLDATSWLVQEYHWYVKFEATGIGNPAQVPVAEVTLEVVAEYTSLPVTVGAKVNDGVEETGTVVLEDFVAEPWLFDAVCKRAIRFPTSSAVITRLSSLLPAIAEHFAVMSDVPAATASSQLHHW